MSYEKKEKELTYKIDEDIQNFLKSKKGIIVDLCHKCSKKNSCPNHLNWQFALSITKIKVPGNGNFEKYVNKCSHLVYKCIDYVELKKEEYGNAYNGEKKKSGNSSWKRNYSPKR